MVASLSLFVVEVRGERACGKESKSYLISVTDMTDARRRGDVLGFNGTEDWGSTWFRWDLTFKVSAVWVRALALSRFVWLHTACQDVTTISPG